MNSHSRLTAETLLELNRKLLEQAVKPLAVDGGFGIDDFFKSIVAGMARDPARWLTAQNAFYRQHLELWGSLAGRRGISNAPARAALDADRRFRAKEWLEPYFQYLVQSYLVSARWVSDIVANAQAEPHVKKKMAFFAQQVVDAMSPANFLWSNPEALKLAAETGGESLRRGLQNLSADFDKGQVSMTDDGAFEVGRNLATTAGAVVFENDFFQLIQYRPVTATVHERPLLMVPPCINKYYILDLQPENSFVRFAVGKGHTVFMVSWRNAPGTMGKATWDDYLQQGILRAIDTAGTVSGARKINVLGFCIGGTLLASALAVLQDRARDTVASLSLLATMLDFRDAGDLGVFVDEAYVRRRERDFAEGGVLHGRELALTFASLRANDLVWHYVVNNYLKGNTPEPFDLLYWNGDSTNLPGAMYVYYLRNMYLENNLSVPGKLAMCGVPVDLGRIGVPTYLLAAREDHIVPWKTAYASLRLLGGDCRFVLAASGHIAGVVNPPSKNRRSYWINDAAEDDPERWLAVAGLRPGSWWTHWSDWLEPHGGEQVGARMIMGGGHYAEIEPAPGRYVKEKAFDS